MTEQQTLTNSRGFQVPVDQISPQDLLKNELVVKHVAAAKALHKAQDDFKRQVFSDAHNLIALLEQNYDVKIGGAKGNITLTSFDGKLQVQVGIADQITFGNEIDIAKQLITEVIEAELAESNGFISQLVRDAFEADKQGNYNKNRIMSLRKYRHANDSDAWKNAMNALDDAIIASSSKTYIRFAQRNEFGKWVQIPLAGGSL